MADIPTPPNPIKKLPKPNLKGLPKWAYIAAIGIGGAAVWYGVSKSRADAASMAADATGVDPNANLSSSSDGQVYPDGGLPSGSGFDYSALGTLASANQDANSTAIRDLADLLASLKDVGVVGGGGSAPGTPTPVAVAITAPKPASPHPTGGHSACPAGFPRHNSKNGAPGPNSCYTCRKASAVGGHPDKRYPWRHIYASGQVVKVKSC